MAAPIKGRPATSRGTGVQARYPLDEAPVRGGRVPPEALWELSARMPQPAYASLVVNAWPPEWAFWLGLGGPSVYAVSEVPMANPYAGIIQPGTRLPPVQSMFTPVPAIPATGPGMDRYMYQMGWAFASGATVQWSGRTNRGRGRPSTNASPGTRFPWITPRTLTN